LTSAETMDSGPPEGPEGVEVTVNFTVLGIPTMATILPPYGARNIGSLIDVQWQGGGGGAGVITGWKSATFLPLVGETIELKQDTNPSVVVTFTGAETTATLIAAFINAYAGITPASNPADVAGDGSLYLAQAGRIEVVSMTQAMFNKLGLPKMSDDPYAPLSTSTQLPVSDGPFEALPPTRLISSGIPVPAGANKVVVMFEITCPVGVESDKGFRFAPIWSPAGELTTDPVTSIADLRFQLAEDPAITSDATNLDSPFGIRTNRWEFYNIAGIGAPSSTPGKTSKVLTVPPHSALLRLYMSPLSSLNATASKPPYVAPTLTAKVGFYYG
jgi:hypothetical protein